ncbi:MAG: hypothetical protein IK066_07655 [Kiritimatiellae bacterium]|nr:hypothetical protein [Kiritimatiellia bacterium]
MRLLRVETEPLDVWGQMALDEWMLDRGGEDVWLRFHEWAGGPAASFGYPRRWRDVERELEPHLRANCARRATGGGVVRHGADVTFSCVVPYPYSAWNPMATLRVLHEAIGRGFQTAGLDVCLYANPAKRIPGSITNKYRQPVAIELIGLDGREMLRGGLRFRRGRFLYQGSVSMDDAHGHAAEIRGAVEGGLEMAIRRGEWVGWPWRADAEFARLREKYRSAAWRERF